jgi:hypothetical protein
MTTVVDGSAGVTFSSWNTAGRPTSPSTAQMGWNTDLVSFEVYNGTSWGAVGGSSISGGINTILQQQFGGF